MTRTYFILTLHPHNLIPTELNEIFTTIRTNKEIKYCERIRCCNSITFEIFQSKDCA
jgi:hypothetical protein